MSQDISDIETTLQTDAEADAEERKVLYAALDSFRQYRQAAHFNITHLRRQAFYSLPSAHADLLCEPPFSLPDTFRQVDDAIDHNADIAEAILAIGLPAFGLDVSDNSWKGAAAPGDLDKARSTIRQLYRDWSSEGEVERRACFAPIMKALEAYLPESHGDRSDCRVLVPGAGIGRLVFDLCLAGYTVEGNEISYHQLLASNYLLNYTQRAEQHTLFPFSLGFSNHHIRADQLYSVKVPDVHPGTALALQATSNPSHKHYSERMSMSAGDFCVIYRQPENADSFDAVTACFFIDTAPNLINYIEAVRSCLKPGGIWINIGPLLWHFESSPTPAERARDNQGATTNQAGEGIGDPGSFELSNDEVLALLEKLGFTIKEHEVMPAGATGYIQDPHSMLQNIYKPVFWIAVKNEGICD